MPHPISPRAVAAEPGFLLVDIRPPEERSSSLGFLPGSVGLLPGESIEECLPPGSDEPVVLYCTSGRRSARAAEELASRWPGQIYNLTGGVLAWQGDGLPTCGLTTPEDVPRLTTIDRFPRLLLSCFAAETVENALDGNEGATRLDPALVIQNALTEPRVIPGSLLAMLRALDRTAEVARRSGFPLDRIASNTDRFRAALLARS